MHNKKEDAEFYQQYLETEEFNKTLPDNIKFPQYKIRSGASCHSKLLSTKEISKLLQINTTEINEQFYKSSMLDLELSEEELGQLSLAESQQQSEAQILQPTTPPFNPNQ